ncbi:MAG TPA: AEC family transporter [Aquabacterium sp.]|nr:AEC family transporter [Aquabacterium sp.]HQC95919.1 AEC family transporter [Aquabacterium sp.]
MLRILEVTVPFFGLVGLGWLAARRGWLPMEAIPGLNRFVLYFALPCMLFRFAAATPVARLFDAAVFGSWLLCALLMVALAIVLTKWSNPRGGLGWNDAAFGALVTAFPNSGFMGVPLLVDLLGERAAAPAIASMVIDMVITSSLCIGLSRLGERGDSGAAGGGGAGQAMRSALKGIALNPLPWAISAGCVMSAFSLALPPLLGKPVAMLANAASPAALFVLGAVLARTRVPAAAGARSDMPVLVTLKLLVHPLLVLLAVRGAAALGLPVDPLAATVLVLVAALPSASNVPMLAERFGADAGRTARVVLWTTVLAFGSFMAAVGLLVP